MIYTVFSTTDNPYMNWQSRLLEFSWEEVNQPGELIRLVATSERDHLPSSQHAKVIPTWPWDKHPITGDRYVVYNKPASLSQWLTTHKPEGTVLFIDPDCVFRAPIITEVTPGHSLSQKWIDFLLEDAQQRTFMTAGLRPGTDLSLNDPGSAISLRYGLDPRIPEKVINPSRIDPAPLPAPPK